MAESTVRLYEGMFLIKQGAAGDLAEAVDLVRQILDRSEAQALVIRKWDDRKLAYPIQGQKRGLYLLALCRVSGAQIANIERDCNLSEKILRLLMTRADHMGQTEIDLAIKDGERTVAETKPREKVDPTPGTASSEGPKVPSDSARTPKTAPVAVEAAPLNEPGPKAPGDKDTQRGLEKST